jgi:CRISPR-associated protein Cas1
MGTLFIDRKGLHVKLDGNALAFYANGVRDGMVPIGPLTRVVVVGAVTVETPVFHRLADEGVSVILLSGRRNRFCGMLHGKLHNNGLLRLKQYEKAVECTAVDGVMPFGLALSTELVHRKTESQGSLLKDTLPRRPDLSFPLHQALGTIERVRARLEEIRVTWNGAGQETGGSDATVSTVKPEGFSEQLDTLRGLEGSASAAYFSAFTKLFPESLHFTGRNRRPPRDPVNALLSLCYTLLHYEVLREIEVTGLDPTIGFYHQFEYGRESLACDLVELFRAKVDGFVYGLFRERVFTARDFVVEEDNAGCYLRKLSRKDFYPLYEKFAADLRPLVTAEVRTLARRIMDGKDPLPD